MTLDQLVPGYCPGCFVSMNVQHILFVILTQSEEKWKPTVKLCR